MTIPTAAWIREALEDEAEGYEFDLSISKMTAIIHQAMEWAETGKAKATLKSFARSIGARLSRLSRDKRIDAALEIMAAAMAPSAEGVSTIEGPVGGVTFVDLGEDLARTPLYDNSGAGWFMKSWIDIAEDQPWKIDPKYRM